MTWLGSSDPAAVRREIERIDAAQASIAERMLGSEWQSPDHYDVILNTARMSAETCVAYLTLLARSGLFRETDTTRRTLNDMLVETRIRITLDRALGRRHHLDLVVEDGEVVLSAMPGDQALAIQAAGLARGVKGVEHISLSLLAGRPR